MELNVAAAKWQTIVFISFQGIIAVLRSPTVIAQSPVNPAFDFSVYPECNGATTVSSQTAVPKLADTFSVKVEGKSAEWAFFDSAGYYDRNGQRGATYVLSQGNTTSYLYDFLTGNAFSVIGDDGRTCEKENLWATGCNTYAYFMAEVAGYSNISYNCNMTASNITDKGVQSTTIRAIKVHMWEQCVNDNRQNLTYKNKYYYTAVGVIAPSTSVKNPSPVPIRFESLQLDGTGKGHMSVYDFTSYIPEVKDQSVFLPGRGIYCPGWYRGNHSIPSLPSQFSLTMTTLFKMEKSVHNLKVLKIDFDLVEGLASYMTRDSVNGNPVQSSRNRTLSRAVYDHNNGWSLTMPTDTWYLGRGDCTVTPFDDSLDVVSETMHMRIAREVFQLRNRSSWTFVGERDFDDMLTNVWVAQRTSYNVATRQYITVTTEAYWLNKSWADAGETILVGIITYRTLANGTIVQLHRSTIADLNSSPITGGSLKWMVISAIRGKQQHVSFCLNVENYTNVTVRMRNGDL